MVSKTIQRVERNSSIPSTNNNWFKSKSDLYGTFTLFNFLTNPSYEILKNANIIKLDELETKILEYDFVNNNEFIIDFIKTKKRET